MENSKEEKKGKKYDLSQLKVGDRISAMIFGNENLKKFYPKASKENGIIIGNVAEVGKGGDIKMKPLGSSESVDLKADYNKIKPLDKGQIIDTRELNFPLGGKTFKELSKNMHDITQGRRTQPIEQMAFRSQENRLNTVVMPLARVKIHRERDTGTLRLTKVSKLPSLQIADKIKGVDITPEMKKDLLNGKSVLLNHTDNGKDKTTLIKVDKELQRLAFQETTNLSLPSQIKNNVITPQMKKDLREGKFVNIQLPDKNGEMTTVSVGVNPVVDKLEFTRVDKKLEAKKEVSKGDKSIDKKESKEKVVAKTKETTKSTDKKSEAGKKVDKGMSM